MFRRGTAVVPHHPLVVQCPVPLGLVAIKATSFWGWVWNNHIRFQGNEVFGRYLCVC